MFQNAAIDVAIGLILMYLMLSLLCTVVNEFIASWLNLRSASLKAGLQELLDDPQVRKAFYDHGLIAGTRQAMASGSHLVTATPAPTVAPRTPAPAPAAVVPASAATAGAPTVTPVPAPSTEATAGPHPSYLSADTFVLALLGSLTAKQNAANKIPTFADVESAIAALPDSQIKSALTAHLMTAQNDFATFRKNVATWFDDSMERLSGAYKRNLKIISVIIGCMVAVIMNASTFEVGKQLWSDNALRAQMVQSAELAVKQGLPQPTAPAVPAQPGDPAKAFKEANDKLAAAFKETNEKLRPLPIGWTDIQRPTGKQFPDHGEYIRQWIGFVLVLIAGWLVTGLALSLGAPFWFDLLSKFMNIRAAGPKPPRKDEKK